MARTARLAGLLRDFRADVVHLASPFVLGWQAVNAGGCAAHPDGRDLPDRRRLLRREVRSYQGQALVEAQSPPPPPGDPDPGAVLVVDRTAGGPRYRPAAPVGTRRRHRALPPREARPVLRSALGVGEIIVGYVGRLAPRSRSTTSPPSWGSPACASSSSGTAPLGRSWSGACPVRCSSGTSRGSASRRRWRASTSSSTPARARPSARRSRRPSRAACRSSRRGPAVPSTSCAPASTAGCTAGRPRRSARACRGPRGR